MKRFGILLCVVLIFMSFTITAEEATLIDFSTLTADDGDQNSATIIDFSNQAGTSFTEEEKSLMRTSLAIENWEVILAPSSRSVVNTTNSYTREAPVKDSSAFFAGETILGARIHFPEETFNSWAIIAPPFEIPAYEKADEQDMLGSKFDSYGVVKNVGVIKSISIRLLGKNFSNGLGIILEDQNNEEKIYFMNYLDFDGWKTLTWQNPNYIDQVRNRELNRFPLYPKSAPHYKLKGVIVYRDAAAEGGDFITYIKDISMVYDKAVLTLESDIDDEALWGILNERETARRNAEYSRLGEKQILRYLESLKMHREDDTSGTTE